jgi:N-acetylmuramoyl-L-alanine amidase
VDIVNLTVNGGHGPKNDGTIDPGAIGRMGLKEYQQTDQVGRLLVTKLQTRSPGINTQYIQDGDLWDVSEGSDAFKANYFISLHCDSFERSDAGGITSYCLALGGPGERLARFVQDELVRATGLQDRGVRTANFHVLRETNASAALIEIGFISNLKEEALMNSDAWDNLVAEALFIGICKFLIAEGKQITYTTEPEKHDIPLSDLEFVAPDGDNIFKLPSGNGWIESLPDQNRLVLHLGRSTYISMTDGEIRIFARGKESIKLI